MRIFFTAIIFLHTALALASPREYHLLLGKCTLPFDPIKDEEKLRSSVFACQKGDAYVDMLYMTKKTVATLTRLNLRASAHWGPTHALFYDVFFEQTNEIKTHRLPFMRTLILDTAAYQFGNPSTDHFRFVLGQQRPAFGVNHFPDIGFTQLLNPRYIWGPPRPGINVIFDSQNAIQYELGWVSDEGSVLVKPRNHWVTSRLMYDFALAGSTRTVFSVMAKKTGEKRVGFGIYSRGPKQNSFQVEWVRMYQSLAITLGDLTRGTLADSINTDSTYTQLIRLSYEDPPDRPFRMNILFDDLRFRYRLFAVGASFRLPIPHSYGRLLVAFKQDTTISKQHRWLFGTGLGFEL